jgi:cysteine-S-conjugate beta-lyase
MNALGVRSISLLRPETHHLGASPLFAVLCSTYDGPGIHQEAIHRMMGDVFDGIDIDALRARRTVKWSKFGPTVLAGWVAEMDFPTAPVIVDALNDAIRREQFGYPVFDAQTGLPEAFASWSLRRHEWNVDPSRVHTIPDVLRGVALAIEYSTRPGSPVILPTPAYMPFFDVIPMVRRAIVEVPHVSVGIRLVLDLDRIDAAFAAGAGSIILCHPHNPAGMSATREELEDLAAVVERHGGYVISDEIHSPLTYPDRRHIPYASISALTAAHSITFTSASKAWNLAGLKCALAVTTNDDDLTRWQNFTQQAQGASTLGIEASVAAFSDGGPWLDSVMAYLDTTRRWFGTLLFEHLPELRFTTPEATYFAWLNCERLSLPQEPAAFFLRHGNVALNEGATFGNGFENFIRLNVATSRPILEQIVGAMEGAVSRWRAAGAPKKFA